MEKYDLVDSDDNVVGVTDKESAHEFKHLHRVAAVFVFTQDGRLYLQEHMKASNRFDHSIGGHVLLGESYEEAAKREAYEELRITDPLVKIATFLSDDGRGHMFGLFEVYPSPSWRFKSSDEVKKIIPMSIPETVSMMNEHPNKFTRGFRWTMHKYLNQKQLPESLNPEILYL